MSGQQAELPAEEEFEKHFTVFDGSSPEDVSHAKQLWNSLWLLPPQESRLVSADIRQRLPVARAHRDPKTSGPERLDLVSAPLQQRREDRQRYLAMANQREEILALLRKQREQRIQRELLSRAHKPKKRDSGGKCVFQKPSQELEMDKAIVKQLQ